MECKKKKSWNKKIVPCSVLGLGTSPYTYGQAFTESAPQNSVFLHTTHIDPNILDSLKIVLASNKLHLTHLTTVHITTKISPCNLGRKCAVKRKKCVQDSRWSTDG